MRGVSKRQTLLKSGNYAIEELSKALSASAGSDKLTDATSKAAVSTSDCYEYQIMIYSPSIGLAVSVQICEGQSSQVSFASQWRGLPFSVVERMFLSNLAREFAVRLSL
jgi:hypothetical protein